MTDTDIVCHMPDVADLPLEALLARRPVLAAEIRRVRDQAEQDRYRYSAFASFVDLPPASERGRRDVTVELPDEEG